jgi:hypothetical protein
MGWENNGNIAPVIKRDKNIFFMLVFYASKMKKCAALHTCVSEGNVKAVEQKKRLIVDQSFLFVQFMVHLEFLVQPVA